MVFITEVIVRTGKDEDGEDGLMSDRLSAGFTGIMYRAGLGAMLYTVYVQVHVFYTRIHTYVPARNHHGNNELDVHK